jgi:fatty acid desaturase
MTSGKSGNVAAPSHEPAGRHGSGTRREEGRIELPTLLVATLIYVGWLALTAYADQLPPVLIVLAGGWLIAWHGSLQHEVIHGHPTPWLRVNTMIGAVPLSLWLPYVTYRRSHLGHHATPEITDPFDDPESRYLPLDRSVVGRVRLLAERAQATLAGRLVLGPAIMVVRFLAGELHALVRAPATVAKDWLPHLVASAILLWWLNRCGITLGTYVLMFVYPGLSLTLLRSFAEHRAAELPGHRVATVERAGPFALLFLHNNLHVAHHQRPGLPWYRLPSYYRQHRERLSQDNGGLVYSGYADVVRRYLFRAHDSLVHPDHAQARRP